MLTAAGIADHDPVRAGVAAPQPDIDHIVSTVIVMAVDPDVIGQRAVLDLDRDLTAICELDTNIGTAFTTGEPDFGADIDHTRLHPSPFGKHRLSGHMPHRLGPMFAPSRRATRWMGEVRAAAAAPSRSDDNRHDNAVAGVAHRTDQCAVADHALGFELAGAWVGGIGWCEHVLSARDIERHGESAGEGHSGYPCRIDGWTFSRLREGHCGAALFE